MATEEYSVGYDAGYQDGWNAAMEAKPAQPQQEPIGVMVSMDVSKGDEPERRIFGRIYEVQEDTDGVTYLAIADSRNFTPQPTQDLTDKAVQERLANSWGYVKASESETVGALTLGGIVQTSEGLEFDEWDVEWNSIAVEALQEKIVTNGPITLNLYTTPPPQRTFVGLSDDDVRQMCGVPSMREAEAKLKEKNQ